MTNDDATEAARPDAPAPLPWETFEGNEGWLIFGPNNELVAYCDYGTDEDNSYSEKATAAFIVIPRESRRTSVSASDADEYRKNRQPPSAGPSAEL